VPAIMTQHLMPLWHLTSAEAGLMASAYAFGYMLAVPLLATLTDRIDARKILFTGSLITGVTTVAFGLLVDSFLGAMIVWGLAGISFAGAYMPGLKALTDRLPAGDSSRAVTSYTSSYSLGVGLSFLVSQLTADAFGWRAAFVLTGLGPLMMVMVSFLMPSVKPSPTTARMLDFAPVLKNRAALGYILGYGAHCFELAGIRTWIVGFWTYVVMRDANAPVGPIALSAIFTVLAMPSSLLGNEVALRFGRHRALSLVMTASGILALIIGFGAGEPAWLLLPIVLLYTFTVSADSGALTSGMAASAEPSHRGATMALHSTVGYALSALGAGSVGLALDAAGGQGLAQGWCAAFAVMGVGVLLGPIALYWSRRKPLVIR
jgi:predicted MFS family arabinose efflux permease